MVVMTEEREGMWTVRWVLSGRQAAIGRCRCESRECFAEVLMALIRMHAPVDVEALMEDFGEAWDFLAWETVEGY